MNLIRRLKGWKMARIVLLYLGSAWLVLQVATLLGETFDWPAALLRLLVYLLAWGLLVVVLWISLTHDRSSRLLVSVLLLALGLLLVTMWYWQEDRLYADRQSAPRESKVDSTLVKMAPMIQDYSTQQASLISADLIETSDYFPLREGNYWIYEGTSENQYEASSKIVRANVRITMSVIEEIHRSQASLFIIEGHPEDVPWSLDADDVGADFIEVDPDTHAYLIISNKIFFIDEDLVPFAREYIFSEHDLGEDIVSPENYVFEFPLFIGQKYGDFQSLGRRDKFYSWIVGRVSPFELVVGERVSRLPSYSIIYSTLPDRTTINFSPRVGITEYRYHHNGTVANTSLSLANFSVHTLSSPKLQTQK